MSKDSDTSRLEALAGCFDGLDENTQSVIRPLLHDAVFLEGQLDELRSLPHIRIHPSDRARQEQTPASKVYAAYISRYTDIVNKLCAILRREGVEENSPLRAYLNIVNAND